MLHASAQTVKVAAAANLQTVIIALQKDFKMRTGIDIEPVSGSSGKLVAQISNGAPYDVFLSADMDFPEKLYKDGSATDKPEVYALGSLIICSNKQLAFNNWQQLLQSKSVKKIAIANPAIAPYGKAAEEALTKAGILHKIKSKAVYGESISQVNTYITTGVVEVGFTTQSLVKETQPLYWKAIDTKMYAPIQQGIVLLTHAKDNIQAQKFYQYILSPVAKRIFKQYGYKTL
ncbi:molybdate ABC transporter substrate-binding protein [Mucilaginibacter gynuensis]|uniref:Molybdate ABC transporter substrate-binding protein n=1 Tax=Mucilaginibacter gynuensis TaxID=1302236 RepID=A0ABP8GJB8_9SPHI